MATKAGLSWVKLWDITNIEKESARKPGTKDIKQKCRIRKTCKIPNCHCGTLDKCLVEGRVT
jgi:hypothetical protein